FIYFAGGNKVWAYVVTFNGNITSVAGSPFFAPGALELSAITIFPSGKFLIVSHGNPHRAWSYTVNTTSGVLTLAPGMPVTTGTTPSNLTISRSNKFAYISCQGGGITAYAIDQTTGALTSIPGSPFSQSPGNSLPAGITVDQSGKYVYVEGKTGVDCYRINTTNGT